MRDQVLVSLNVPSALRAKLSGAPQCGPPDVPSSIGRTLVSVGQSDTFAAYTSQGAAPLSRPLAQIEAQVEKDGPSGFDPAPFIRRLAIPMLWLYGGLDIASDVGEASIVSERVSAQSDQGLTDAHVELGGDHA